MVAVAVAVAAELAELEKRKPGISGGALGAAAHAVAAAIDDPVSSATAVAACAKSLREIMDRLYELVPDEVAGDVLDDLSSRREKRRARVAGS